MTPDEAMQAVKKAVDQAVNTDGAWPHPTTGEIEIMLAALRAIEPGGPLIVIPREHFKQLADRDCGAHCAMPLVHEQRHSDFCNKTRAMIAEGEKL